MLGRSGSGQGKRVEVSQGVKTNKKSRWKVSRTAVPSFGEYYIFQNRACFEKSKKTAEYPIKTMRFAEFTNYAIFMRLS